MGFEGAFALLVFLGATWYGLLQTLLTTTRQDPASTILIPAAFAHWAVFLYSLLAAAVVYGKGSAAIQGKPQWLDRFELLLLRTWPAALGASMIGFCGASLVDVWDGKWIPFTFVPLVWFLIRGLRTTIVWTWSLALVVGFVPYMFVMSQLFAGVEVATDKSEYLPGEPIVVTATSFGYLFNPSIRRATLFADNWPSVEAPSGWHHNFLRVSLKREPRGAGRGEEAEREYVEVKFLPQGSWFERKAYRLVILARQGPSTGIVKPAP